MKIIIIGSGIAGLTLALACQKAGMKVKIYDKAKELRNIGGGILLWPHGIRYLEWLGVGECLHPFWLPIHGCHIIGHHGKTIFSENYAALYSLLGGSILPIDRSQLQQALLSQLAEHTLSLGKTCMRVQSDQHHAQVIFADGTKDSADIIIGADGIFSSVRKNFNANASLQYTNYCWWGGIIEQKYVPHLSVQEVYMAMTQNKLCIVWPTIGGRFMWYLPVKMPMNDLMQGNSGLHQLQRICANWNDDVHRIITAPASTKRFHLPIHVLPPQTNWTIQRIVLIGDAAHALGPILGQGASQAIEDAFVLFQCLQHLSGDIPSMLKRYETLRRSRYERLSVLENQAADSMISDTIEALESFQQYVQQLDLATMYQDLIPLVNEKACLEVAAAVR